MKEKKMSVSDARAFLRDLADAIPCDAADIQLLYQEEIDHYLFNMSEAPYKELPSILYGDGYIAGLEMAMKTCRIPPFDDPKLITKTAAARGRLMVDFIRRKRDAENEHI